MLWLLLLFPGKWTLTDLTKAFGMAYVFVVYSLKEAGSGQHMWLLSLPDITLLFKVSVVSFQMKYFED